MPGLAVGVTVKLCTTHACHGVHVFVTTARQVDQNNFVLGQLRGQFRCVRQGVAAFQRGNNALDAAAVVEGLQCLIVSDAHVLSAA